MTLKVNECDRVERKGVTFVSDDCGNRSAKESCKNDNNDSVSVSGRYR
jgi:hypothetical protein